MTAFFNFLQFKKAPSLISLTESGIVISVNFLLPSKAHFPIISTLSSISKEPVAALPSTTIVPSFV